MPTEACVVWVELLNNAKCEKDNVGNLRFQSINELREIGVTQSVLEKLADADAFNSMGLDRREALWEISTGNDRPVALFAGQSAADPSESSVSLPKMRTSEHVFLIMRLLHFLSKHIREFCTGETFTSAHSVC